MLKISSLKQKTKSKAFLLMILLIFTTRTLKADEIKSLNDDVVFKASPFVVEDNPEWKNAYICSEIPRPSICMDEEEYKYLLEKKITSPKYRDAYLEASKDQGFTTTQLMGAAFIGFVVGGALVALAQSNVFNIGKNGGININLSF